MRECAYIKSIRKENKMKIEDCNTRTIQIANSMLKDKMEDELLLWEALDFSQTLLIHDAPKSDWQAKANRFAELEFLEEIKSAILQKDMQKLGKHFYSHIHRYLITCSLWEAESKSDHEAMFEELSDFERGEYDAVHGHDALRDQPVSYENGYNVEYARQQCADAQTGVK